MKAVRVNSLTIMTKTTYRQIVSDCIFNDVHAALEPVCESMVSWRCNARYGPDAFVNVLMAASAANDYVSPVIDDVRDVDVETDADVVQWKEAMSKWQKDQQQTTLCPTPQWLFDRLRRLSMTELVEKGTEALDASIDRARKLDMLPKSATFAVDGHDIPCHAPMDDNLMRRSKPKSGTSKMEAYLTMQMVGGPSLTTSTYPYTTGDSAADILSAMIHHTIITHGIGIDKLLLDRGFYSVSVLHVLHKWGIPYIMAVPKSKPIKKYVEAFHNGTGGAMVRHTVKSGKDSEEVVLLIHRRKDADKYQDVHDKYIVLAFSGNYVSAEDIIADIPEEYRKRWAIETGYRSIGNMRAKTRSMTPGVRMFLFMFSAMMANFWAISNWIVSPTKTGAISPAITISFFTKKMYKKINMVMTITHQPHTGPGPPLAA